MLPRMAPIERVSKESYAVKTFVLGDRLEARAGQFVMIWLPGVGEKPLSIAAPDPLTICVAEVGPFSMALHRRKAGDWLGWRGPFGRGFTLKEDPILLVAGGYGAAPLYFLAQVARGREMETTVAIGARREEEIVFVKRFADLGCRVIVATEDGSRGLHGPVTEAIGPLMSEVSALYGCGPEPMLYKVAKLCWERGLWGQLSLERYMKCGLGVCGQCALDDRLVCLDGPVFSVEELAELDEFGHYKRSPAGRKLPLRSR